MLILVFPSVSISTHLYVGAFLAHYFGGKVLDEIWDTATGKPDIRKLERRLTEAENQLNRMRPGLGAPIEDLRNRVTSATTKGEFQRLIKMYDSRIASLESRMDGIETRVNKLETDSFSSPSRRATVCCDDDGWVYVREGPWTQYDDIGALEVGQTVRVRKKEGDWWLLDSPLRGYMHDSRLEPVE